MPLTRSARDPLSFWLIVTAATALAVTAADAVLLQARKGFFTGGFLATVHLAGAGEAIGFLSVSFLADAAIAGLTSLLALLYVSRLRLTERARFFAVTAGALGPLVAADFVAYRLWAYLGDAFDLGLMFDLTGRSPREILAVSAAHLAGPAVLVLCAVLAVLVALVWLNRPASARHRLPVTWRVPVAAVATLIAALLGTTAARTSSETFDDGLQRKPSGRVLGWVAQVVTDVDGDGFGIGSGLPDPDPLNASIYPYALDVPGDGIDQDGVAGDLPADTPGYAEGPAQPPAWVRSPNVVLVVLESFRADAVGRAINGKPVTPVLDALAAGGVSASHAFSHNGYTAQSRFHIFSGSLADVRDHRSLVDDFKGHGYEVAYFSAQDDSFGGAAYASGMDRADIAFDARQDRARRYTNYSTKGSLAIPASVLLEHLHTFLGTRRSDRPLFLYLNFHDTHFPYHHAGIEPIVSDVVVKEADITPANADAVRAMYFNTAANVDRAIGVALADVTRTLGAPPAVIVLSDHGESLFDEGFLGHGYALNDVQTRIPLIVSRLPMTVRQPFGQADLRDAIGAALSGTDGPPTIVTDPARAVFQYLGNIDRPRQIGFVRTDGRDIYDFRTGLAQPAGGGWQAWAQLEGDARTRLTRLVHYWESLMITRGARTDAAPE